MLSVTDVPTSMPRMRVAVTASSGSGSKSASSDGTMRAADQQASSNSTFVAVGGQRLGTSPQPSDQSASEPAPGKGAAEHDADDAELEAVPVPPPPAPSGSGTTTANPAADASSNGALEPAPASSPAVAAPDVREKAEQAAPESELPYTLHVGSYRTIEKAYEDIANLQKRGFEGRAVRTDLGSKGVWYRVYVGAYPTRAEALATSRLILELPEYKYAQVVRVPRQ